MRRMPVFFAVFLGAALALNNFAAATETGHEPGRASFNASWLFARFGVMPDGTTLQEPAGLEKFEYDDAAWRHVRLPHDWGIEGPFSTEIPASTGKLPWAGIGWYRKHFTVPQSDKGKNLFVDFDGAMSHAKVWLNGKYVGEWPYGYASFRLEVTPHIHFGGENIIAVRLDNPPNSSRWYPGGGLYRNVWLVTTPPVHVAYGGIFVRTPVADKEGATVLVTTEIVNQSASPADITVRSEIVPEGKNAIAAQEVTIHVPPGGMRTAESSSKISSPTLWDVTSPHLYTLRTSVRRDGQLLETHETVFGIRRAEFSPDSGFLLNGKKVRVNGVCNHHDLGPLGSAINMRALERQIQLLQEMGCNAIRTSHNPPAPELLQLCDRMGMLVLDEAFDCWVEGKTPNDYSTLFAQWHEKDIRAYVRRDRNHPCVIAWSAGNEVREQDNGILVGALRKIFRSEDPTRPVTAGCDNANAGYNGFQDSVDVFGYNYKPHLYGKFRAANPTKPLFATETASCVSTNGEYFFPVSDDKSKGALDFQVSSYDLSAPPWATSPDVEFAGQEHNPFVAGEFVWTGFDYLGEPTPWGEDTSRSRSSYFGIMDLCGFKKDRFYIYQSRWRPELPIAHILPHWNWPTRIGEVTPVHVYTSGDEAELFLNGQSLGRKKKMPFEYRLRWDDVRYAPGELYVVAYKNGVQWATDTMRTTGPSIALTLKVDRSHITSDGNDLAFVTVTAVDARGEKVPTESREVRFDVSGSGVIAAVANGDPTSHESFQSTHIPLFHGQCLVIIRSQEGSTGSIRLLAETESLKSGELFLTAD